jgi:gamma-glutamyltranspeptidase/glutathione hydrolase
MNILEFNLSTDQAVNAPKFHHQWLPDEVYLETGFPNAIKEQLEAMGYKTAKSAAIGRTEVIKVNAAGLVEAVGDNRGDDSAAGY